MSGRSADNSHPGKVRDHKVLTIYRLKWERPARARSSPQLSPRLPLHVQIEDAVIASFKAPGVLPTTQNRAFPPRIISPLPTLNPPLSPPVADPFRRVSAACDRI